jgi:DNA polymerase (family 10)
VSTNSPVERDNAWIAGQLRELAARLELEFEDGAHRPRAYRRAAETIESLRRPIADIHRTLGTPGLDALPGIGPRIASIVVELLEQGHAPLLDRLRRETPVDVMALLAVDGIGRKTLQLLWRELGVCNLDDLEGALSSGRVRELPGFGSRREERLRQAVRIQRRDQRRHSRKSAEPLARRLRDRLADDPRVLECEVAGSLRRGTPTVGDIDLVAGSEDAAGVASLLLEDPDVELVYSRGPQRVSVRLKQGIDVDLRTVPPASFGSALLYFTGSRAHTLALRRLALAQGLRLNEYGLFRGRHRIAGSTEAEIYEALALPFVPPAERRGESEIRDALRKAAMRGGGSLDDEASPKRR